MMDKVHYLLVIGMLAVSACSRNSDQADKNAGQPQATWKLICVGDGFTAGVGVQPDEAYPAQLSAILSGAGKSAKVVNAGIKGESVADFGERLDWLLQQRFDAMLLAYGMEQTDDALQQEARGEDWSDILQRIKAAQPHATIWIGTATPGYWERLPRGMTNQVGVLDLSLPPVDEKSGMWVAGGYPSKQGHEALARRLADTFLTLVWGKK